MSTTLDLIVAAAIGGLLMLTILTLNANLTDTTYQSGQDIVVQSAVIDLAQRLEYDLRKAGYHAKSPKITHADSASLTFKADVANSGSVDTIAYTIGPASALTATPNPNDFFLLRSRNGSGPDTLYYGLTYFALSYYDSTGALLPSPVSASNLPLIKGIYVQATVEAAVKYDSSYAKSYWEDAIFPKNL